MIPLILELYPAVTGSWECGYSWLNHRGPCLVLDLRRLRLGLFSLRSGLLLGSLLLGLGPRLVDLGAFPHDLAETILLGTVAPYIDPRRYPLRVQGQSGGVLVDESS